MASMILKPEGTVRDVRNLGWLLRHWKDVHSFTVCPHSYKYDCWLVAYCNDGTIYETEFASLTVLQAWLHRPVFRNLPVHYRNRDGETWTLPA